MGMLLTSGRWHVMIVATWAIPSAKEEADMTTENDRQELQNPLNLCDIMKKEIIRATMDTTLGEAVALCFQHRIRHLPIIDLQEKLVGLVTDRDLRLYISHRMGTIMENSSDRETLHHRLNVIMIRRVITGKLDMTVPEAAQLMLDNHIGCLPVVSKDGKLAGIVTSTDFIRLIAHKAFS
jgi:acetoin utilization protein AcuB